MTLLFSSYFAFFGLEPGFRIDEDLLESRYAHAQKLCHPDQQKKIPLVAESSHQTMAQIHEAYHHLKDPLKRAQHLLMLHQAWPIDTEKHPVVFEKLFEIHQVLGLHPDQRSLFFKEAQEDFERAFQIQAWQEAQSAYMRMNATRPLK